MAEAGEFSLQIFLVGGKGKFSIVLPNGDATLGSELKELVAAQREDCPVEVQLLICSGKKLADDEPLSAASVKNNATVYVGKKADAGDKKEEQTGKTKDEIVKDVMAALTHLKSYAPRCFFAVLLLLTAILFADMRQKMSLWQQ